MHQHNRRLRRRNLRTALALLAVALGVAAVLLYKRTQHPLNDSVVITPPEAPADVH